MELKTPKDFADQTLVAFDVLLKANGLRITQREVVVTWPTNKPDPYFRGQRGSHPQPCAGCSFVIDHSSVSANYVWGVAGGLQETVKHLVPYLGDVLTGTGFRAHGYALPEAAEEAKRALVRSVLATAKFEREELQKQIEGLDKATATALQQWGATDGQG